MGQARLCYVNYIGRMVAMHCQAGRPVRSDWCKLVQAGLSAFSDYMFHPWLPTEGYQFIRRVQSVEVLCYLI